MDENCYVEPVQKYVAAEEQKRAEIAFLTVWGMDCPCCAARVRNSLLLQNGVVDVYADHITGVAGVSFIPEFVSVEMLLSAVANAGRDGRHEYGTSLLSTEVTP